MEAVLLGRQATVVKLDAFPARSLGFCGSIRPGSVPGRVGLRSAGRRRRPAGIWLKGVRSELTVEKNESAPKRKLVQNGPVRLFVGLPLDAVSDRNGVNHGKAIAAGLRALKLLGMHGVEFSVSWGAAQPDSAANAQWDAYLAVADMARAAGLRLRVSLHIHAARRPSLPLPIWVTRAAAADPDILFTDRSGRRHSDCLSLAVDELPVLDGMTPLEAYESFFRSFRSAFADFLGSTISDVTVSLGPNGELRYPSFLPSGSDGFMGVGEFQCYDKYILAQLKQHAEAAGKPLWGLSGPHDAPEYNHRPDSSSFFKENGGSWETPYGDFFLSWYSQQLLDHGDRVLSVASKVFDDLPVQLSAKVPLLHWWHCLRSHPAELTAGFYNTDRKDGYDAVAKMFAKNSCAMIIPGIDLSDQEQPQGMSSSPESLVSEIKNACQRHGVQVSGENSLLVRTGTGGFSRIKEHLMAECGGGVESFTYQRMGADFFSPEHWPMFVQFVRSMKVQPEMDSDDLPGNEDKSSPLADSSRGNDRQMQAV